MEQIKKDSIVANETKTVVSKEEEEATTKAEKTQAIADDAQKDLDEALPMLDAALASLKSLNKNDVVEVCSYVSQYVFLILSWRGSLPLFMTAILFRCEPCRDPLWV